MKLCVKCGKDKALGDFYLHSGAKDGRRNHCKACVIERVTRWQSLNKPLRNETLAVWRERNREALREYSQNWRATNLDRSREIHRVWRAANPSKLAAWTAARRAMLAGVKDVIRVESDSCGVCHDLLDPSAKWPDPMSTTIGHEPPLSRLAGLGLSTVTERPEHWMCNFWKRDRTDSELESLTNSP